MAKVLGVDLGTTNSCMAVMEGGEPVVISNAEGGRTTPSVVGFSKSGERLVGQLAKRQSVANPDRTVTSIKRVMGTDHKNTIDGKDYTPQEISAMILRKMKADAEAYLGEKVEKTVITVPAYFTDSQKKATRDAGVIAGLDVLRIINEPTAAALAYGLEKSDAQTVLVFDLGGGTFDVSILELGDGVFEVKATSGNNNLGGDDFDERIIQWMTENFRKEHGVDLSKDRMAVQRLKEAAEKAKVELSGMVSTNINLPFITAVDGQPVHLDMNLTRAKFEELTADLVEATIGPTKRAIADAELDTNKIDKVILVGGSTRIPVIQETVKKLTGKEPYKGVNPDEVVAIGAAIQGGVLMGEVKDVVLLDVTPLSLGIETLGGVFTKIIERNTTIPTTKKQIFSTAADNQTSVDIHVLQGERSMVADNVTLGRFRLDGIPPAPRGIPQIEVAFDIDANGIVNVSAKDLGTGKEQKVTITSSSGLSKEEIEKLMNEADAHAEEDKKRREQVELRNEADTLVYTVDKTLKDIGDKAAADHVEKVKKAKEELSSALAGEDYDLIREKKESLQNTLHELSATVYQQTAGTGGPGAGPGTEENKGGQQTGTNGPTVDADYKVKDDENNQ